jgi:hypothetical protein
MYRISRLLELFVVVVVLLELLVVVRRLARSGGRVDRVLRRGVLGLVLRQQLVAAAVDTATVVRGNLAENLLEPGLLSAYSKMTT